MTVKVLELSGVGRVAEGRTDEEDRVARMDGWVVWEGRAVGAQFDIFSFFFYHFVKGDTHPELCAQRIDEVGGFSSIFPCSGRR